MEDKLVYSFLCPALTKITENNPDVPVEGMKLLSALAHKFSLPVTWLVDSYSANQASNIINNGHHEYGDQIILHINISGIFKEKEIAPSSKAEEVLLLQQHLPDLLDEEIRKVKEALPWWEFNVVSVDAKSEAILEIFQDKGCKGLWGYRWNDDDNNTDKGCPWSFFFISKHYHNIPGQDESGIVGIEQNSLNLNSAYHSGNYQVFSVVPKSMRDSKLIANKNLSYANALINEYIKNVSWNRFLTFIQAQSAWDMQYSSYQEYNKGTIEELVDILNGFFREVRLNKNIQPITILDAVKYYKNQFSRTESCSMLSGGIIPMNLDIEFFASTDPKKKPPYPMTFFYYDHECQMIFNEGEMFPVEMRNYFRPPFDTQSYIEKEIPTMSSFRPSRDREKLIMEFDIESIKKMPFGLTIWDDHSTFNLVSTNARAVKWIGNQLIFIRLDLEEGLNNIEVSLSI
ncbi:hypothetical protein GF312_22980 [Candidatus Poribacteria bacterium]|nr:hypothetical protein [Candidatus Poribacteria bacterium]